ncbi:hypothetical protein FSY45_20540 [Comamonas sp. Z1]|nr:MULTISPECIES: hypothetical protein [unclassified Comamonas]TYK74224.1 hypothetical protein FSY45_20540 [Comamonas sp. Z1]UUC96408.1 hypothetical protein NOX35_27450 [Comamonas sp. C11]
MVMPFPVYADNALTQYSKDRRELMKEVPFFIERNTEQWQAMWGGLSEAELNSGDHVCENQETGDCWHYMGSDSNGHHFRHRKHPKTAKRETLIVKSNVTPVQEPELAH